MPNETLGASQPQSLEAMQAERAEKKAALVKKLNEDFDVLKNALKGIGQIAVKMEMDNKVKSLIENKLNPVCAALSNELSSENLTVASARIQADVESLLRDLACIASKHENKLIKSYNFKMETQLGIFSKKIVDLILELKKLESQTFTPTQILSARGDSKAKTNVGGQSKETKGAIESTLGKSVVLTQETDGDGITDITMRTTVPASSTETVITTNVRLGAMGVIKRRSAIKDTSVEATQISEASSQTTSRLSAAERGDIKQDRTAEDAKRIEAASKYESFWREHIGEGYTTENIYKVGEKRGLGISGRNVQILPLEDAKIYINRGSIQPEKGFVIVKLAGKEGAVTMAPLNTLLPL